MTLITRTVMAYSVVNQVKIMIMTVSLGVAVTDIIAFIKKKKKNLSPLTYYISRPPIGTTFRILFWLTADVFSPHREHPGHGH